MTITRMTDAEIRSAYPLTPLVRAHLRRASDSYKGKFEKLPAHMVEQIAKPGRGRPFAESPKPVASVRLDADVYAALKSTGRNWSSRVNDVMRGWLMGAGAL